MPKKYSYRRKVTHELAEKFAALYAEDLSQSVESAALAVGLVPNTVRDCFKRFRDGTCATDEDEEICGILYKAKSEHHRKENAKGWACAWEGNAAGANYAKWRLEVGDPLNNPRGQRLELEHSGKDGGPIETKQTVLILPDNGRLAEGGGDDA